MAIEIISWPISTKDVARLGLKLATPDLKSGYKSDMLLTALTVLGADNHIWWFQTYRNDPKFSDRYAWANIADPDQEQSDQGLHCLPFCLHHLDSLLYDRATKFKF